MALACPAAKGLLSPKLARLPLLRLASIPEPSRAAALSPIQFLGVVKVSRSAAAAEAGPARPRADTLGSGRQSAGGDPAPPRLIPTGRSECACDCVFGICLVASAAAGEFDRRAQDETGTTVAVVVGHD